MPQILIVAFVVSLWLWAFSTILKIHRPEESSNIAFNARADPAIVAGHHNELLAVSISGKPASESSSGATELIVGLCTVAGALIGVFYQLRLKARSENRQKWINNIRDLLADLIADIPTPSESYEMREKKKKEYLPKATKLELLFNPSEEVHRALMALLRHVYGFDDVPIDCIPRAQLGIYLMDPYVRRDFIQLKSQIIRLSNVALKREWEQVKHAR